MTHKSKSKSKSFGKVFKKIEHSIVKPIEHIKTLQIENKLINSSTIEITVFEI